MKNVKKWLVLATLCILSAVSCGCTDTKELSGNEAGNTASRTNVSSVSEQSDTLSDRWTDTKELSGNEAGDTASQTNVSSVPEQSDTPFEQYSLGSEVNPENTKAMKYEDAATLNSAWKNVYSAVMSGTVTKESKCADGSYCDWAADKTAPMSEKRKAAKLVTMAQVQAYNGTNISLENMYYVTKDDTEKKLSRGTILYWDGNPDDKPTEKLSDEPITEDITLGELYSE